MSHQPSAPPVVAIIGRPNVGKSTLFNRVLGARTAIVDDVPGVTRDRNYADGTYQGRAFRLVDTGGLDPSATDGMLSLIRRQSQLAIAEADILIFLMDGRAGLTPGDEEIVSLLRGVTKPAFYTINKIDTPQSETLQADFYRLGQETLYPLSAEAGTGVDELLEAILPLLPVSGEGAEPAEPPPRIAIVGRPNVGKSTLINTLLGQERMVVFELPGTTRDSVDTTVSHRGRSYIFTDTAGIRRRGRIERGIEGYSVARAMRAMGRSDVALLILDAVEGITEQDTKIAGLALKQGRACLLLVNKWDLRQGDDAARRQYELDLRRRLPFLPWAPVLFGSALKPDSVSEVFPLVDQVVTAFTRRIPTGLLNKFLQEVIAENPLPVRKGKPGKAVKSVYVTQVATQPPVFALFVGHPEDVGPTYLRFLEHRLRERFEFLGTSIRILVRRK
ncbi:MAG: ribosome biogenesis GTPase Der [Nitrospirae bacterium 13_2_20CM_2_62_8]|nr:MAG: ribosome biogenesis GTPase Der [Nitrospirae bacterium 13_2_20CM_2_62_8]